MPQLVTCIVICYAQPSSDLISINYSSTEVLHIQSTYYYMSWQWLRNATITYENE